MHTYPHALVLSYSLPLCISCLEAKEKQVSFQATMHLLPTFSLTLCEFFVSSLSVCESRKWELWLTLEVAPWPLNYFSSSSLHNDMLWAPLFPDFVSNEGPIFRSQTISFPCISKYTYIWVWRSISNQCKSVCGCGTVACVISSESAQEESAEYSVHIVWKQISNSSCSSLDIGFFRWG